MRFGCNDGKGICKKLCYAFRVFGLLIKPVVFYISSFLTSSSWLRSISLVTLPRKRVLDMRRFDGKRATKTTWHRYPWEAHHWAAREGNALSRNFFCLCRKTEKDEGRNSQKALTVPFPLHCGRFLQGGDWPFQIVWRTDLEVDVERTHWIIAWAYWLYIFAG